MCQHPLVVGLSEGLGDRMKFNLTEYESPPDGCLNAVMTDTGSSLRVRRRDGKYGTVALISIRNGEFLIFPSRAKLNRCFPGYPDEVEAYMSLVSGFGCYVDVDGNNARHRPRLSRDLAVVLQEIDELTRCLQALADRPGAQ